jgi:LmbE family N-acetylglucosaminyl deacetylase
MNILVFAPHADDEILGVGGTIAKYVAEGHNVFVCVVTCGHPSMFPAEFLKNLRSEALEAHRFLGVRETLFLEFPAVMLHEVPVYKVNEAMGKVVKDIKPRVVFIPHYGDIHIDHGLVSKAAMVAVRPVGEEKVLEVYSYETLSETEWNMQNAGNVFLPDTWVDISKYINKKINAMSMFSTQVYKFPHPRSLEALRSLAKLRGSTVGVKAAEAFSCIRRIVL